MLFGCAAAALAGFMLTTIPNWTGRLPVSGLPLLALSILWCSGRIVMAMPDVPGPVVTGIVDTAFLIVLAAIATREIVTGRNWRNLKIVAALFLLAAANAAFHVSTALGSDPKPILRGTIAVFIMLIGLVGGRIVPSFTGNWLARRRDATRPRPFGRFDAAAMVVLGLALGSWVISPQSAVNAGLAALASAAHLVRLARWRGLSAAREPMIAILHLGYLFIPLGMAAVAWVAIGGINELSALHLLTVGAIGTMTLAVMTRATMGHTGRTIAASASTRCIFASVIAAAAARPMAEMLPDQYLPILVASGMAWCLAFLLFCLEYGTMLLTPNPPKSQDEAIRVMPANMSKAALSNPRG
jgi:uncharacterized protein involved in response to NO